MRISSSSLETLFSNLQKGFAETATGFQASSPTAYKILAVFAPLVAGVATTAAVTAAMPGIVENTPILDLSQDFLQSMNAYGDFAYRAVGMGYIAAIATTCIAPGIVAGVQTEKAIAALSKKPKL